MIVADPNYALMYGHRARRIKTDRRDVAALAEACRLGIYRAAHRVSAAQREVRRVFRIREQLVRMRTQTINLLRAQLRQEGIRLGPRSAETVVPRLDALALPDALRRLAPLRAVLASLAPLIAAATADVETRASADPVVRRLLTVPGIGPITALTYRAALDMLGALSAMRAPRRPFSASCRAKTVPARGTGKGRLLKPVPDRCARFSSRRRGSCGANARGAPRYTPGSSASLRGAAGASRSSR